MAEQFDVVVIGGGPAGYAAALYGASAGLKIAVVEKDKVGGTCLHRGCIPAKEYLETAAVYRTVSHAKDFGVAASQPTIEFATSQQRKQKVVDQLWKGLAGLMKQRKITTYEGVGRLDADGIVRVTGGEANGTELQGTNVLLCAGSVPRTLPGFDVDGKYVLTSDEVLMLDTLPTSAVVVGGGAIGCEFASSLSDLGVQVTILEFLPQILAGCDKDAVDVVARSFKKRGIDVKTGVEVKGHTPTADGKQTVVTFGEGETITADVIVMSVGRRPLTENLLGVFSSAGASPDAASQAASTIDPATLSALPDEVRDGIVAAYADALAPVFWYLIPFVVVALLLSLFLLLLLSLPSVRLLFVLMLLVASKAPDLMSAWTEEQQRSPLPPLPPLPLLLLLLLPASISLFELSSIGCSM